MLIFLRSPKIFFVVFIKCFVTLRRQIDKFKNRFQNFSTFL